MEQVGRSARLLVSSASPWPHLQKPWLQTPDVWWLWLPSNSPWGYNRSLTTLLLGESPLTHSVYSSAIAPLYAMYSRSPSNLQHAEATGSDSCPVVPRRLVGPANTIVAKRIAALSSRRQSSRDFRAISIIVWARGPGILWWLAQWPTSSITENSSSGNPIWHVVSLYLCRKKSGGKLTRLTTRVVPAVRARSWLILTQSVSRCRVRRVQFGSLGEFVCC